MYKTPSDDHNILPTTTTMVSSFFFVFFFSIISTTCSSLNDTNQSPFTKIYAFGDSSTDTGNSDPETHLANFSHVTNPPYGATYFHHPANRYSDGRLVIDFVALALSLPFVPPYSQINGSFNGSDFGNATSSSEGGVNFAVPSTAIEYEFFVKNNLSLDITPKSILTQLGWFEEFLEKKGCAEESMSEPECVALFEDALFWVGEIGVSDYAYTLGSNVTHDVIRELSIKNVNTFLQALIKKGAKYIVVQGQPPAGCLTLAMYMSSPEDRDDLGCVASGNNKTYEHNTALQALLQNLSMEFPETVISYADYWSSYTMVLRNPSKYGFTDLFDACCGSGNPYNYDLFLTCGAPSVGACPDPSRYINWDGIHLTEAMYKIISDLLLVGEFSRPPFSYLVDRKRRRG